MAWKMTDDGAVYETVFLRRADGSGGLDQAQLSFGTWVS